MRGPCERRGTEGEAGGAGGKRDARRVRKSEEKRALAKETGQQWTKGAVGEFIKQGLCAADNAKGSGYRRQQLWKVPREIPKATSLLNSLSFSMSRVVIKLQS